MTTCYINNEDFFSQKLIDGHMAWVLAQDGRVWAVVPDGQGFSPTIRRVEPAAAFRWLADCEGGTLQEARQSLPDGIDMTGYY